MTLTTAVLFFLHWLVFVIAIITCIIGVICILEHILFPLIGTCLGVIYSLLKLLLVDGWLNRPSLALLRLSYKLNKYSNLKLIDYTREVRIVDVGNTLLKFKRSVLIRDIRRRGLDMVYQDILLKALFEDNSGGPWIPTLGRRHHHLFYSAVTILLACALLILHMCRK